MSSSKLRVLALCTNNRSRSVLMAHLFDAHARRLGLDAMTRSAGTDATLGQPPTSDAIRLLRGRGIDASRHRSHAFTDRAVLGAHLIVTARKHHVVAVAGRWPEAFCYTFTLPEIVALVDDVGPRNGRPLDDWLALLGERRSARLDYLDADVGEVTDPTGGPPKEWKAAFARIDDLTFRLASAL